MVYSQAALDNMFTHHPPTDTQVTKYQELRSQGRIFASILVKDCPPSIERDTAMERLRECIMWANASIACNEK